MEGMEEHEYEFAGDYYQCEHCHFIWDWIDDACPECGKYDEITMNAQEVRQYQQELENETNRIEKMLQSHGE
jgi:predicted ATP-dependent serine protease